MSGPVISTAQFEVMLEVCNYLEGDDYESAFDLAKTDEDEARAEAHAQLTEWLGDDATKFGIAAEFVEFDSNNPHHAGAAWQITLTGEPSLIDRVQQEIDRAFGTE